jgi:hypothetical protein
MSAASDDLKCPHCGNPLDAFNLPDGTGWENPVQWACFNDDCSYYRDGWEWMWDHYAVKASYRFRMMDPATGRTSPLPVWSDSALRDRIIEEP